MAEASLGRRKPPFPLTAGRLLRSREGSGVQARGAHQAPRAHIPAAGVAAPLGEAWRRGRGRSARGAPHLCSGPPARRGEGARPRGLRADSGPGAGGPATAAATPDLHGSDGRRRPGLRTPQVGGVEERGDPGPGRGGDEPGHPTGRAARVAASRDPDSGGVRTGRNP